MNRAVGVAVFSVLLLSSIPSYSLPFYGTSISSNGTNNNDGSFLPGTEIFSNVLGGTASTNLPNETYQDLRNYGLEGNIPVSTVVTFGGQAEASSAGLRSRVFGQQFSEVFTPSPIDVLHSGQAQYHVASQARFFDTLSVAGASDLTSIQFDVNIHGTRQNAPFGSFIQVDGSGVLFGSNDSIWDGIDDFDIHVDSAVLDITGGSIDVSLSLLTSLSFFLGGEGIDNEELGIFREVDFFNTVTINQFRGFNSLGDLVDLSSVIGSDGQVYDTLRISTVPVPPAAILFASGLLALFGMRKKS